MSKLAQGKRKEKKKRKPERFKQNHGTVRIPVQKFPPLLNYCGLVALMICLFKCGFVPDSLSDRLTGISQLKLEEFGWYSAHPRKFSSDPLVSSKWMHFSNYY